jgi:dinuclear metal center YbgI/SA1388 family protein
VNVADFIKAYESWCPADLALADDPVGLQIGSLNQEISRVLVTLDIREQTVAEAIAKDCQLILAKHPVIFRPLAGMTDADSQEAIVRELVQHDIAVYTCHTGIDILQGGLNDYFCELLDIKDVENFNDEGLGRIGNVEMQTVAQFSDKVKQGFGQERLRTVTYDHSLEQKISRVAICGGSGGNFWREAREAGADVYITADIYYHTAHDMLSSGLLAIDPGHYMERLFVPLVATKLREVTTLEVVASKENTNPFYDV